MVVRAQEDIHGSIGYFDYTNETLIALVAKNNYPVLATFKTNSFYQEYDNNCFYFNEI